MCAATLLFLTLVDGALSSLLLTSLKNDFFITPPHHLLSPLDPTPPHTIPPHHSSPLLTTPHHCLPLLTTTHHSSYFSHVPMDNKSHLQKKSGPIRFLEFSSQMDTRITDRMTHITRLEEYRQCPIIGEVRGSENLRR